MNRKSPSSVLLGGVSLALILVATGWAEPSSVSKIGAPGNSKKKERVVERMAEKPAVSEVEGKNKIANPGDASGTEAGKSARRDEQKEKEERPLAIPLVEGFPSFGLRIPDMDDKGRLRSIFVIGAVSRVNDREVQIKESYLETYGEDGSRDMGVELPEARLDLVSRVLVAKVPVTIRRDEFEVTGATMEFNTLTKEGGFGGPVKMRIFSSGEGEAGFGK